MVSADLDKAMTQYTKLRELTSALTEDIFDDKKELLDFFEEMRVQIEKKLGRLPRKRSTENTGQARALALIIIHLTMVPQGIVFPGTDSPSDTSTSTAKLVRTLETLTGLKKTKMISEKDGSFFPTKLLNYGLFVAATEVPNLSLLLSCSRAVHPIWREAQPIELDISSTKVLSEDNKNCVVLNLGSSPVLDIEEYQPAESFTDTPAYTIYRPGATGCSHQLFLDLKVSPHTFASLGVKDRSSEILLNYLHGSFDIHNFEEMRIPFAKKRFKGSAQMEKGSGDYFYHTIDTADTRTKPVVEWVKSKVEALIQNKNVKGVFYNLKGQDEPLEIDILSETMPILRRCTVPIVVQSRYVLRKQVQGIEKAHVFVQDARGVQELYGDRPVNPESAAKELRESYGSQILIIPWKDGSATIADQERCGTFYDKAAKPSSYYTGVSDAVGCAVLKAMIAKGDALSIEDIVKLSLAVMHHKSEICGSHSPFPF